MGKQASGSKKRKLKRQQEEFINFQRGSLDKFFTKKNISVENQDDEISERVEDISENEETHIVHEIDENGSEDKVIEGVQDTAPVSLNINDPRIWDSLDGKMRDLLVEKGVPREIINIYPRDSLNRGFSPNYYFQKMSNGELFDRKWLVYSKELDKVFCFCCKVVRRTLSRSQLSNEGSRDWKHLGDKLTDHESSREHLSNFRAWNELRVRLSRNQTIDKELQEQIKKDTDHWRDVMVRIISVVKRLAVNNIPFRDCKEKIYENSNGNFLGFLESIGEFDPVMKHHFLLIQNKDIHYHYLSHKIQNELIVMLASSMRIEIIKKIKKARYFFVILDCTPDASHQEQMTLIIRLLCDMANSCIKAKSFFGACQAIYNVFANSTKRWNLLQEYVDELTLKSLSATRWESRCESVKAIKSQLSKIKEALIKLLEINMVSKILQADDMILDVAIENLKGLISFFDRYRDAGFTSAMIDAKEIANEMGIEHVFSVKRKVVRKRHFDEIPNTDREQQSAQEDFRTDYFLVLVDMALSQLKIRFEQMQDFDSIFGFMFDASRLTSLDDEEMKICCSKIQLALEHGETSDIDAKCLLSELQILQEMLPNEACGMGKPWNSIKIYGVCKKNGNVSYCFGCLQNFTECTCYGGFCRKKFLEAKVT
ncbi:hypothetical protein OROHE_020573 [Orobanche hederae]